jgi:hypothetical protein
LWSGDRVGEYRLYLLDTKKALKGPASRVHFSDDGAAIKHAEQMIGGEFVELWVGERRVGRFDAAQLRHRSHS